MVSKKIKNKKDIFDESIILNYFDGLKWNLDMYINGACIDYHFIMNNKNCKYCVKTQNHVTNLLKTLKTKIKSYCKY